MAVDKSPGQVLSEMLADSLAAYRMGPVVGDRERQVIWGVTPSTSFVDGMTLDGVIARSVEVLTGCGRVFRYGNTIVLATDQPGDRRLTPLATQARAEANAASILANLFGVAHQAKQGSVHSMAATKLVGAVLADEFLHRHLEEIRYYARRPTFDADFNLCKPGWNAASGNLVHAPEIIPTIHAPASDTGALNRLPPLLRGLFCEFSWRSDADLVNALAMLLTGLLINHFVDDPHPGGIVDANQPGTGKTLYVQVVGQILDGAEPPRTALVRDEELEKRLCAQLRSSRTSVFFFDNVRDRIESAVLEQNMLSPLLSFRVLGRSATIERPNHYLWFITSNMAAGTPDFIRRCVPIRQFFEGDPKSRVFQGNPLAYATRNRQEILGELAGMVLRWVQGGRPSGSQKHRCDRWASMLGGILDANGLGEFFLANVDEAEAQMDQGMVDLASLAEHVVARKLADFYGPASESGDARGRTAGQWAPLFAETRILGDRFADAAQKGKATAVGMFLSGKVNRAVAIETADGPGRATLRRREAGAGQKFYYFELTVLAAKDGDEVRPPAPAVAGDSTPSGDGPASGPATHDAAVGGGRTRPFPRRPSSPQPSPSPPPPRGRRTCPGSEPGHRRRR